MSGLKSILFGIMNQMWEKLLAETLDGGQSLLLLEMENEDMYWETLGDISNEEMLTAYVDFVGMEVEGVSFEVFSEWLDVLGEHLSVFHGDPKFGEYASQLKAHFWQWRVSYADDCVAGE
jgi:hypothetical protein